MTMSVDRNYNVMEEFEKSGPACSEVWATVNRIRNDYVFNVLSLVSVSRPDVPEGQELWRATTTWERVDERVR